MRAAAQMIVARTAVRDAAFDLMAFTRGELDRQLGEHIGDAGLVPSGPPVHEPAEPLWDSGDPEVGLVGGDLAVQYGRNLDDEPDAYLLRATQGAEAA